MTEYQAELEDPYNNGVDAYFDGLDLDDNPYDANTDEWYGWRDGWIKAKE